MLHVFESHTFYHVVSIQQICMYSNVAIHVDNYYSHQWFFVMHYRLLAVTMYWSQEWKLMPVVFVMEITALQHLCLIHHLKSLTLVHYYIIIL